MSTGKKNFVGGVLAIGNGGNCEICGVDLVSSKGITIIIIDGKMIKLCGEHDQQLKDFMGVLQLVAASTIKHSAKQAKEVSGDDSLGNSDVAGAKLGGTED